MSSKDSPQSLLGHYNHLSAPPYQNEKPAVRRQRQRRLHKLEQASLKKEKSKMSSSNEDSRIFSLPGRLKATSLFIRMGSVDSESDPVPLDYIQQYTDESNGNSNEYGVREEEPEAKEPLNPHPEAILTRKIFHLGEGLTNSNGVVSQPLNEVSSAKPTHRPYTIILPLPSALKKPDSPKKKRPRSLRILDPKDQKLYMAFPREISDNDDNLNAQEMEITSESSQIFLPRRPDSGSL